MPKTARNYRDGLQYAVALVVIVLLNIIGTQVFFRLDLTEDQRYTLNPATETLLEEMDRPVLVDIYLEGEFPAGFARLQKAIREKLDEFRVYAGDNVQYRFVDPNAIADAKERAAFYRELQEKGVIPTNLVDREGAGRSEKVIWPGAIVRVGDREEPVIFLQGDQRASNASPEARLNQSVEGVEYRLASAIQRATLTQRRKIGLIRKHGELDDYETYSLTQDLQRIYDVQKVDLDQQVSLEGFDAIIVAKPDSAFSEPDKFKIDQFVVNGGRALFFVDPLAIELDSIGPDGTVAFPLELNLLDLFFKWGVRINPDLIQDLNAAYIPMFVGYMGDQPQMRPMPWWFFPLANQFADHPITKNLDAVYLRFVSTIDTVKADGITKTPLMFTSQYSRIRPSPARVNFNEARLQPQREQFQAGPQAVAYLLEGRFQSLYTNRLSPVTVKTFEFREQNEPSQVLIVSDGDLPRNEVNRDRTDAFPLGFDRVSGLTFSNRDFIMNALEYMLDEDGVVLARNKEIALRPLDAPRIEQERVQWQLLNLVAPLALLVLFGVGRYFWRKRKYERKAPTLTQA
ncbi:gliding-associated putative ABC transporter substrate-binding component GldG [Catalinimonas alkaloidigena]|uniref:Gliding-associated putative ABC transporter substrate-binding component GldG n=1 Tax=Catalinimonas alkaloidigena TaxID=1075417 RepID=A0A1G9GB21_9BACT|nr:gliding motility-associated ABC transporter substrate-binding protein GldG [Catalinimonas alkaloidigena]SDK97870.1 gliding-associated putative ABC transporter substrate-binding component GldG [Catalinimonas alkaloidigena]